MLIIGDIAIIYRQVVIRLPNPQNQDKPATQHQKPDSTASPAGVGPYNVLIITATLNIGGQELSSMGLTQALLKRGHSVRLVTVPGLLKEEFEERGLPLSFARVNGRTPMGVMRGAADLRALVERYRADIIHSQTVIPAIMGFFAKRGVYRKAKVIWHDRGIKPRSYPVVARLFNYLVDFVITNSDYERNKLIHNGLKAGKVATVHNGMYLSDEELGANPIEVRREMSLSFDWPLIVHVARLAKQNKGHRFMFAAMTIIAKHFPNAHLLVVGDGPLRESLEATSRDLGVASNVHFVGAHRDVGRFYAAADIVVLPSILETFGNVSIEAMAFGKPVVASRVGGIPEVVIDGQTGLLVPPKDPNAIAAAILQLLRDPALRQRMGEAGRARMQKHFTMDRVAREVETVYARLVT